MTVIFTDVAYIENSMYGYIDGKSSTEGNFNKLFRLDTCFSTDAEIATCLATVDFIKMIGIKDKYINMFTDCMSSSTLINYINVNKGSGRHKLARCTSDDIFPWWNHKTFDKYILQSGYTLNASWISRELNKQAHEGLRNQLEFNTKRGIPIESWSPLFPTKFA